MGRWVCKPDGAIQCLDIAPISLDEMRKELASIVGEDNILGQAKRYVIVPKMCGIPAGSFNAYELTPAGYYILVHGFVGRRGFLDCRRDSSAEPRTEGTEPVDYGDILAATNATSAASHPVLIRELIGRLVRVYEVGSAIDRSFFPERTNIVTDDGRIADIWFG